MWGGRGTATVWRVARARERQRMRVEGQCNVGAKPSIMGAGLWALLEGDGRWLKGNGRRLRRGGTELDSGGRVMNEGRRVTDCSGWRWDGRDRWFEGNAQLPSFDAPPPNSQCTVLRYAIPCHPIPPFVKAPPPPSKWGGVGSPPPPPCEIGPTPGSTSFIGSASSRSRSPSPTESATPDSSHCPSKIINVWGLLSCTRGIEPHVDALEGLTLKRINAWDALPCTMGIRPRVDYVEV